MKRSDALEKAWSHSKHKYAKGIDCNPNQRHSKSQASKEIKVHNGMKKHKITICKQIFNFLYLLMLGLSTKTLLKLVAQGNWKNQQIREL